MKSNMHLVAFALCFAVVSAQTYVTSFPYEGLELIFNNQTSFMDQIGWFNGSLYVSGAGYIHQIQDKPFELSYNPWFENWRPYLSFDAFIDPKGNSWVFGPVTNQMETNKSRTGLVYPIQITGRPAGSSSTRLAKQEYLSEDFIPAACAWGNTTTDKHSGYFVGWTLDNNGTTAHFSLIRTVINTENVATGGTVFEFNPYYNLVVLHSEGYTAYNRDYKPWIFHSSYEGLAIIVDPASFAVYKVLTPADPNQHLVYNPAEYPAPNAGKHQIHRSELVGEQYQITSATYDYANEHVYVGVAAWGLYPGRILIIDVRTMDQYGFIDMGVSEGNPIAMDFDVRGPGRTPSYLYVAFFGLHHIAKYSLTGPSNHAPVGYVTLPPSLNSIYRIANYDGYIHFVTNEQFGKVGRVPLSNFCPAICDTWNFGYCLNGRCACGKPGTALNDKDRCEIVVKTDTKIIEKEKEEHHGEVALGILFALTFILAAVGWYLYYKARGGRSPLENSGLLQRR